MSTELVERSNVKNVCENMASAAVSSPLSQQADLALQEAIRIAQESNDHVCLQHCLVKRSCHCSVLHVSACQSLIPSVCVHARVGFTRWSR